MLYIKTRIDKNNKAKEKRLREKESPKQKTDKVGKQQARGQGKKKQKRKQIIRKMKDQRMEIKSMPRIFIPIIQKKQIFILMPFVEKKQE